MSSSCVFAAVQKLGRRAQEENEERTSWRGCRKRHLDSGIASRHADTRDEVSHTDVRRSLGTACRTGISQKTRKRFLKVFVFTLWQTQHRRYHVWSMLRIEPKDLTEDQGGAKIRALSHVDIVHNDCEESLVATALINTCTEQPQNTGRKPYTKEYKVRHSNFVLSHTVGIKTRSTEPVSKQNEKQSETWCSGTTSL